MKTSRFLLAATAVCCLSPSLANGQAALPHGVIEGLNLVFKNPQVAPTLRAGSGYVDGTLFNLGAGWNYASPSCTLVANLVYYVYAVNEPGYVGGPFNPPSLAFVCSLIPPVPDGHPASTITYGTFPATKSALFLGSFLTHPIAAPTQVIPFYRDGEEVVLIDDGGLIPVSQNWAAAAGCPPTLASDERSYTFLMPQSASAGIFDLEPQGLGGNPADQNAYTMHQICVEDPGHPLGGARNAPLKSCQIELTTDSSNSDPISDGTVRARLVTDANGKLTAFSDICGYTPGSQGYLAIDRRGYVEPVVHLSLQCAQSESPCGSKADCCDSRFACTPQNGVNACCVTEKGGAGTCTVDTDCCFDSSGLTSYSCSASLGCCVAEKGSVGTVVGTCVSANDCCSPQDSCTSGSCCVARQAACTASSQCCDDNFKALQCNGSATVSSRCCVTSFGHVQGPADCCAPNARVIDSRCDIPAGAQCWFDSDCWDDLANQKCTGVTSTTPGTCT